MLHSAVISNLQFKGKWRLYQQRVLKELEYHLNDNKLNIVAAPGAGKTILGIEVLVRLKSPAFILAPTITIKNQWKQRIIDNFLKEGFDSSFISLDIKNISQITIVTYQGLHSIYKDISKRQQLINELKNIGINTLILDEAHHLRTEWWATLNHLYTELNSETFKIVSLTGTPPYDVPPSEWNNYNLLCGPVDAEISIPELVKAGDLCPFQDLIYFSNLTEEEQQVVFDFNKNRQDFFKQINENSDVLYAIESSPFVNDLDNNVDIIYQNTNFTIALISYLLNEDSLNVNARILTEFLELNLKQIPKFSYEIAEIFFQGIIGEFRDYFKNVSLIKQKLKSFNLIKGHVVDLTGKFDLKKLFARSENKLKSITEITKAEYQNLNNDLREVILLDYIGKGDAQGVNILSVFDRLQKINLNCGILTGSLIVIPKNSKNKLYEILLNNNVNTTNVLTVEFNNDYLRVEVYGKVDIVSIITELFEAGEINILIGTAALLGEGWDSPCANTLILASVVGSFMLSNQMRGRTLRIDKNNKNKASNIWHLVSLSNEEESSDLLTIKKRFNAFEGISYKENKIQNGIERLAIKSGDINLLNYKAINDKMLCYASLRNNLKDKWKQVFLQNAAIKKDTAPQIYDVILGNETQQTIICNAIPKWCWGIDKLIKRCSISKRALKTYIWEKMFLKICHYFKFILDDWENIVQNNISTYARENALKALAQALLFMLYDLALIKTSLLKIELKIDTEPNSQFYITLIGCNNYERSLFINSFMEFFIINNKSKYILKQADKYIAVPECIAKHNKNVKKFVKYLEENMEIFDIIYTRSPNGHKELLKARFNILDYGYIKQSRVWI